jgi:hypothetical protein
MKIGALAFVFALMLLFSLAYLQSKNAYLARGSASKASSDGAPQLPPAGNGAPSFHFPIKEQYVTFEGDPFLVLVGVDCAGSESPPRFELLPPSPDFARIGLICAPGPGRFAQALIAISPTTGTRGKYQVKVGATRCGADPDEKAGEILSLNVKVKAAR